MNDKKKELSQNFTLFIINEERNSSPEEKE